MMKKIACVFIKVACLSLFAFPAFSIVMNYSDLVEVLNRGDTVRAIVYLGKCKADPGKRSAVMLHEFMNDTTRLDFIDYYHDVQNTKTNKTDTITVSYTTLAEGNNGDFLNYYVRYIFHDNNQVSFYVAYFDPITNQRKSSTSLICAISNGSDENAVRIYNQPFDSSAVAFTRVQEFPVK